MSKTILLVDDEKDILDLLKFNLEHEGFTTISAMNGDEALRLASNSKPDLIILDVMLPGKDGWDVMRELSRSPNTQSIPVIFLTARDSELDEVIGLELGADDYIVKPIAIRKLIARVKAVFRKTASKEEPDVIIQFADLAIDPQRYEVRVGGTSVVLTKKEFEILYYLAKRPGRVVNRETLLNDIWGDDVIVIDRTVDVHIRKIREKLGSQYEKLIDTIKGVGYRLKNPDEA